MNNPSETSIAMSTTKAYTIDKIQTMKCKFEPYPTLRSYIYRQQSPD